jgi:hypothetical protein
MTQQHPITPPPKLIYKWAEDRELLRDHLPLPEYIATCAAQWGADQELEACCEWLQDPDLNVDTYKLRVARRPQPPSLKEQALLAIDTAVADYRIAADVADVVRRALEQLPDNEPSGNSR